jgi:hypothetical protein
MTKGVLAACLLMASLLAAPFVSAKDSTQLILHKGARVGIVNLMDAEVTHFHATKVLTQSFYKIHTLEWQVDSMLTDAVAPRLSQLELVPVSMGASDGLIRSREDYFVNNSVAKGLPRELARQLTELAATKRLDALIVLAPGVNDSAQAGSAVRRGLPDYLHGWGFVTTDEPGAKPSLFNMTQLLLIGITSAGATLNSREWGGQYTDTWANYSLQPDLKAIPSEQLDELQPQFAGILTKQAGRLIEWITVIP